MTIQVRPDVTAETKSEGTLGGVTPDLANPGFLADPYSCYDRLRAVDPVHRAPWGDWYLTRFDDVALALSDSRFGWGPPDGTNPLTRATGRATAFGRLLRHWPVFMDPPAHTLQRTLAANFFTKQRIEGLGADIKAITAEQLDRVADTGSMDVAADFAYPLPARLMARILGMPEDDCGWFRDAFLHITRGVDQGEMAPGGDELIAELQDYFSDLVAAKRRHPGDDLLSALVAAQDRGEMSADAVVSACVFYMWTGHETTKNLIGNAIVLLLRHTDQMAYLLADPGLASDTVSETLRYEPPVQRLGRWTLDDVDIGGTVIPAGQFVSGVIAAAHRDPDRFVDPGRFDILRPPGPLLAFGRGAHHCLGHSLARMEGEIALTMLLRRTGPLAPAAATMDEAVTWQPTTSIRGVECLPVTFTPRC